MAFQRLILGLFLALLCGVSSFTLVMMGARRSKGNLKRALEDTGKPSSGPQAVKALNQGRGQEITGVTLPAEGKIKGWEFGGGMRVAAAQVDGQFYAVQGACPRCAFDLWKGDLVTETDAGWEDLPRVACPTCATTFSLKTGGHGPKFKRTGLAGFVGNLASRATAEDATVDAKAFVITRDDETGQVFCRDR